MQVYLTVSALISAILLVGCQAPPPSLSQPIMNAKPFDIVVPNKLKGHKKSWHVDFRPFVRSRTSSTELNKFFSVEYNVNDKTSELTTRICNGETMPKNKVYKSCVDYVSDVVAQSKDDTTLISIIPKLKTKTYIKPKGKSGQKPALSIPSVSETDHYGFLSSQSVELNGTLISTYSSESIKGNFDRILQRYAWKAGESDVAHRQFQDTYTFKEGKDVTFIISVGFYPYREGSFIEYVIEATADNNSNIAKRDWYQLLSKAQTRIEDIVSN